MTIQRHADAVSFLEVARDWLLGAEAENNLLLGIALNASSRPADPTAYWATVHDVSGIVGCACRTPPFRLVLSSLPMSAVAQLATDVGAAFDSLNGVNGPIPEATAFANNWTAIRGVRWTPGFRLRLHKLTRASFVSHGASGSLRKATETDLELARDWIAAYVREIGIDAPTDDIAGRLVMREQLFLWVDGAVRAMAAKSRETQSGCAINTVYTPRLYRRQGYATAAVAELSDRLLQGGRRVLHALHGRSQLHLELDLRQNRLSPDSRRG